MFLDSGFICGYVLQNSAVTPGISETTRCAQTHDEAFSEDHRVGHRRTPAGQRAFCRQMKQEFFEPGFRPDFGEKLDIVEARRQVVHLAATAAVVRSAGSRGARRRYGVGSVRGTSLISG